MRVIVPLFLLCTMAVAAGAAIHPLDPKADSERFFHSKPGAGPAGKTLRFDEGACRIVAWTHLPARRTELRSTYRRSRSLGFS